MSAAPFALVGDDPLLAPDQVTGNVDPAFSAAPPTDPLLLSTLDPTFNSTPPSYGPTISQLGADPSSTAITGTSDPSANNSHPSTATPAGGSILDSVLKLGNLGLGIFNATSTAGAGAKTANQISSSNKIGTAKSSSIFSAGNGGGIMVFVIIVFVALIAWAEWGSGS